MQTPDRWVVVKVRSKQYGNTYKILAGWYGGYLSGSSWKLNSGIKSVKQQGDYYLVTGYSGSIYQCHKESEHMSNYMMDIYDLIKKDIEPDGHINLVKMKSYLRNKYATT